MRGLRFFLPIFLFLILFYVVPAEAFSFFNFFNKNEAKKAPVLAQTEAQKIPSLTLPEAYQLALKKSETVALSFEEINQAQARFYRSFDYFVPKASFVMSTTYRDTAGGESGGFGDTGRPSSPLNYFTFSQPIFSGFKEIAALTGSGADKKAQVMKWQRAKELLFVDVMNAYYGFLRAQKNVETFAALRRQGAHRLRQLNQNVRVGRSKITDKEISLADLKILHADLIQARFFLKTSTSLLEFYLGESLGNRRLVDEKIPEEVFDLSESVLKAKSRADVVAAEQAYIVSQKKVVSAQSALFPKISANGNYYTKRTGVQSGIDWDVTVQMDVPLFEVGKTLGDIKEAVSTREAQRLRWSEANRWADLDIRNASADFKARSVSQEALKNALEASRKSYALISSDYDHRLVSNLEVLDTFRRLQDVELRYTDAYFQMKESYWKLKVALGDSLT